MNISLNDELEGLPPEESCERCVPVRRGRPPRGGFEDFGNRTTLHLAPTPTRNPRQRISSITRRSTYCAARSRARMFRRLKTFGGCSRKFQVQWPARSSKRGKTESRPRYFFDTSALVKHYHTELGSPKVDQILGDPTSDFSIARLTLVEVTSVFAKKVRTERFLKPTSTDFSCDFTPMYATALSSRSASSTLTSSQPAISSKRTGGFSTSLRSTQSARGSSVDSASRRH